MDESTERPKKRKVLIVALIVIATLILLAGGYFLYYFKIKKSNKSSSNSTSSAALWPQSDSPWPMFHGNYNHSGYAAVSGPATDNLKWKYFIGNTNGIEPNSIAVAKDDTIFVAGNNKITALNSAGTLKWQKDYTSVQGPGLSADGQTLYFDSSSSLIAVSAADGSLKWKFSAGNSMVFGPTIGPDGTIYQGSWDKNFYAINSDGSMKWKYLTAGAISYPPSIDKNGTIYLGGGDAHFGPDSNIYAFSKDGKLLWKYDTKMMRVGSPAVGYDGLIYFPAAPILFALNPDGKLAWKKGPSVSGNQNQAGGTPCPPPPAQCGNGNANSGSGGSDSSNQGSDDIAGIITPAVTPDGMIYIGTSAGKVFAIDSKTQTIKWSYQSGKNPQAGDVDYGLPSFVIADKDDTSYFGSVDHKFYAIDKDGKLKWAYETGGKITEAAPAMDGSGTIYFSSEDGYIYAIGK